ncbi:S8 family serine peptidase [Shewanella cyperi]|uniref:S8 family serine peptidase n=1 Tax=Shewanella cyperi TaxID=2814292 RepID=A0A974XLB3_9GAMM|nr:S8 family serine peptidase [Shewanella cyperi]QSX30484.1 S8 family serine peptidase [Shewanella cyperi]
MTSQHRLKGTALAVFGALYLGVSGHAAADIGMKKAEKGGFYVPTFTSQDVADFNQQQQEIAKGDMFVAQGKVNHVLPKRSQQVFEFDDSIKGEHTFIVQFSDKPVATYEGNLSGFSATKPLLNRATKDKLMQVGVAPAVQDYQSMLSSKQNTLLSQAKAKGAQFELLRQFTVANNAVAVKMTQRDAALMAKVPGVTKITPSRVFQLRTDRGPEFIHADAAWSGNTDSGLKAQGEGMVVGIIDTGINTDHPAFASDAEYATSHEKLGNSFLGDCQEDASLCNDKLIGVYSYDIITSVYNAPEFQQYPWQTKLIRPRNGEDHHGHGSHTASTVAGNRIENTPLQAPTGEPVSDGVNLPFNFDHTSGVAPRAHIIAYQVCWPGNGGDPYAGCPEEAILAAYEDAIKDGVDVINFSIGGSESFPWEDPMELAFLAAREAGISVAVAAGNSGPYFYSADHTSPWVTTVGASTHDRTLDAGKTSITAFESTGPSYTLPRSDIQGKGFTDEISGQFVLAESYPDPDPNDGYAAKTCNAPFPAGTFTADQIVVCERGDIPRVDKAVNVQAGGAGGLVLLNVNYSDSTVADRFVIPGINVASSSGYTLKNWINRSNGTARGTITAHVNDYILDENNGNLLARFSSMGPSRYIDNLVPDVTAPGVNIYAANADDQPFTNYPAASDWTMMSGTSMASPHVAGAMTLLTQLHPDWSPAEIQSALMLSANQVKFQQYTGATPQDVPYNFMGGAGAIDVAKADAVGLVLDETIDNYVNANPRNGGIANWLNLPSMVDMSCEKECTWMRTVKATKDGSWSVSTEVKEDGATLTASPSQFSLKAGETQAIMVKMTVPSISRNLVEPEDTDNPWESSNNYSLFNGQLKLTSTSGNSPELHMPVVALSEYDQLPFAKDIEFNREQGSESFVVNTDNYSQFTPRYYGLVKPELRTAELPLSSPYLGKEQIEAGWSVTQVVVPEGTKRLMVEVQSSDPIGYEENKNPRYYGQRPVLTMGLDANGNGNFMPTQEELDADRYALSNEYFGEMVCQSSATSVQNFCDIIDPTPGTYWVALVNVGYGEQKYKVTTGVALLSNDSSAGNFSLEGPAEHDGNGNYQLNLNWDLPDAKEGDVYYGGFDLGNMPGEEGTLGFTSLKLKRGKDNVSFAVSQDKARNMDVVDISLKMLPNLETADRDFSFKLTLPEGMRLAPETLKTVNDKMLNGLEIDEHGLSLSGTQESTRDVPREYVLTNSLTSAQCRTPKIDEFSDGRYIDLFEFGMQPEQSWYVGDYRSYFDIPMDWLFWGMGQEQFKLYNQDNGGFIRMHTVGAMQFNTAYWMMNYHRGPGFLYESMNAFWRGTFEAKNRRHWEDPWGLTLAAQYEADRPDLGDLLFMEFDNITDKVTGDEYDYEVIMRPNIDFRDDRFELMFAYNNLGGNLAKGTVFVEGFDSVFSTNAGPKDGYLYTMVGFDNLDEVLTDNMVICFDYTGPEKSAIDMSFKAVIQPEAVGKTLDINLTQMVEGGEEQTLVHSIKVNSDLKVAEMSNLTVAEDGELTGIEVFYLDANKVSNTVIVTGEHIQATVEGSHFSLKPEADFFGDTLVTVTVQDNEHASDQASTSFMLTVTPEQDAPQAMVAATQISITEGGSVTLDASASYDVDNDALSFEWQGPGTISGADSAIATVSGLGVGEHEFTVTVSDGVMTDSTATVMVKVNAAAVPATPDNSKSSSGGSLGWLSLMLLALGGLRRQR